MNQLAKKYLKVPQNIPIARGSKETGMHFVRSKLDTTLSLTTMQSRKH